MKQSSAAAAVLDKPATKRGRKPAARENNGDHDTAREDAISMFAPLLQIARSAVLEGKQLQIKPADFAAFKSFYNTDEIEELVIPKRTLARRTADKTPLTADETDKAIRLARIAVEADRVFGNSEKAGLWLRSANRALSGKSPMELLTTDTGSRIVEELLGQIEHGMFI